MDEESITKINLYEGNFNRYGFTSGVQLLKTIIHVSTINTPETLKAIRDKLSSLDQYMLTQGNDNIIQFNMYMKTHMKTLTARGGVTNALLTKLFKGYNCFRYK